MLTFRDFVPGCGYDPDHHPNHAVVRAWAEDDYDSGGGNQNVIVVETSSDYKTILCRFPRNTVFVVQEQPLLTCDDFGHGLYNTNMELRRVWVEATSDAWGNLNSLMAENWQGQRFLLAHFPRDIVFVGREEPL